MSCEIPLCNRDKEIVFYKYKHSVVMLNMV